MKPQTIKQADIKKLLPKGIKNVFFSDADYAMFNETFLIQKGLQGFKKWLKFSGIESVGQKRYWKRNYDCDNLANAFKTYMNLLHAKANPLSFTESFKTGKANETTAQGVAIGVIYFEIKGKKTSSQHAINIAITRGLRNKLVPIFIEPNAAGKIKLTKKERESIWYVNF